MLMELAKIKFLDENHKIRVYGVIQSFKPDLRFVFKRDAILCIKPRNINLCSRTIICTIEIESLIFTMVWICIVIQAFKVSTVKYHAIIRTSVKIPDDFSRFQIRRRQSFVIAIPKPFQLRKLTKITFTLTIDVQKQLPFFAFNYMSVRIQNTDFSFISANSSICLRHFRKTCKLLPAVIDLQGKIFFRYIRFKYLHYSIIMSNHYEKTDKTRQKPTTTIYPKH